MAMEYLRDDHFRVIGSIETNASGKQVGRDAKYQRVGEYDPRTNQTRDRQFRLAGTGNLLAAMIWRTVEE
ncbi:hypothetical protein LMG27952_06900 [Paraburkholderia hiiakae]|uniref:Uncharacterized protein n=1 Tax=Paraburkholderia hiiakae TaxID=1081782 RepID=A0ABN7IDA5_9BURK|nr:hypothetical protein [Paraburkholderia hiiakae]CAD6559576.1 hypothetical protein LMG27952_06900 [Paraburkholderia hiiakae]